MHYILTFTMLLSVLCPLATFAQQPVPIIKTEKDTVAIYIEGVKENFPHYYQDNPMFFTLAVKTPDTISIVSERDSIAFIVYPKDTMIFDVVRDQGQDTLHCFINIVEKQEPAYFSEEYKRTHRGKTFVEIPEVYELVNIIFALTPIGKTDQNIVYQNTSYYKEVATYFGEYSQEPIVALFDSLLRNGKYGHLKMDAYAFFFEDNQIKKSKTYGGFWGYYNNLEPYIDLLQAFAIKSNFRKFYAEHQPLYQAQITTYRDSIDTNQMKHWLDRHFPSTRYDALKVIFSPLVSGNQSSWHYESNGFKELQAHVNYPYMGAFQSQYPPDVVTLTRGNIVFTEINHGYINPESDKPENLADIEKALRNVSGWIDSQKPAGNYNSPYHCFNEYMNWGLVNLYYLDNTSEKHWSELVKNIEDMMVNHRGFTKFTEFDQFLINLYLERQEGQLLADLYPEIIEWFAEN